MLYGPSRLAVPVVSVPESLVTPHVSIKLLLTQSDERLVRMAAAGHDRAFEAIVDRYRRQLLRYAERFPAAGPAEDVVQAAFVCAWGALRDGTEVRDLRPWLYRIVRNSALNAAKRVRGIDTELVESEALGVGPEAESEIQDDLRRTLDGIAALPGRQRDALVAVAVDGRAHADVGRELGITEPAVRQLVRRARASVRAVASALTPYPLIAWISELGTTQTASVARIGELVGGAGSGAIVIKLGAVAATGAIVVGGAPVVKHAVRHSAQSATVASARAASTAAGTAATTPDDRSPGSTRTAAKPGDRGTHDSSGSGSRRDRGFRRTHGVPPGPSGRLGGDRQGHRPRTTSGSDDRSGSGHEVTPTGDDPRTGRHRSESEHLSPSDSATTAGSEPVEQAPEDDTLRPEAEGPQAPEQPLAPAAPEPPDGVTGSSGPH